MARVLVSKNTFAGEVRTFAGTTAPTGFMVCDGTPVSRTLYPQLFLAIGTSHGDGSQNADGTVSGFSGTHFNLPDYRGIFLRGVDLTGGNDPDKATRTALKSGGNAGNSVGSFQSDQVVSHTHTQNFWQDGGGGGAPNNPAHGIGATNLQPKTSNATGGSETRPKNVNVLYCIKY